MEVFISIFYHKMRNNYLQGIMMVFKNDNDKNNIDTLIFLNSPIDDFEADIIGMEPYVEQLDTAVDKGACNLRRTAATGAFASGHPAEPNGHLH